MFAETGSRKRHSDRAAAMLLAGFSSDPVHRVTFEMMNADKDRLCWKGNLMLAAAFVLDRHMACACMDGGSGERVEG